MYNAPNKGLFSSVGMIIVMPKIQSGTENRGIVNDEF